jgi:DNA-directed RNA polymerase specialized sigma24 family protein
MDSNEHAIYRAAIEGNREAFEMIIRSSSRNLFAIAYGILQSREEAEDVVQDTLVKAWKNMALNLDGHPACSNFTKLHRMGVTLHNFEELDYATIEQTLGLTNGALRGILGRALGAMRRRLKPALAPIT